MRTANHAPVLCYHALSERWDARLAVTPERFERHVRALARRGYRGVSFREAIRSKPSERVVAITFDDAYRSVLTLAEPILTRYGMRATVFAPTALVGREAPMSWPGIEQWLGSQFERELIPLSWDELRGLARAGWEVGSHTRTHPRLTALDDEALRAELRGSREECAEAIGEACQTLAYPYGDYDDRVVATVREAGYEAAGTLPTRITADPAPHAYPRIWIGPRDGAGRFALKTLRPARRLRGSVSGVSVRLR